MAEVSYALYLVSTNVVHSIQCQKASYTARRLFLVPDFVHARILASGRLTSSACYAPPTALRDGFGIAFWVLMWDRLLLPDGA